MYPEVAWGKALGRRRETVDGVASSGCSMGTTQDQPPRRPETVELRYATTAEDESIASGAKGLGVFEFAGVDAYTEATS